MTVKEFMNRPYELTKLIKRRTDQLQNVNSLIHGTSQIISAVPRSDSPDAHRLESLMARAVDLEMEITKATEDLGTATAEVTSAINAINNASCEEVLSARYLGFKDWTTIARELDYCKDWVFRLHRKGLNLIRLQ
ncbi:MAG: hypothetical protein J5800_09840 [Spirochaetales bacterium]|nr:hypothetical protein [Spirochaetales bacterium]